RWEALQAYRAALAVDPGLARARRNARAVAWRRARWPGLGGAGVLLVVAAGGPGGGPLGAVGGRGAGFLPGALGVWALLGVLVVGLGAWAGARAARVRRVRRLAADDPQLHTIVQRSATFRRDTNG